MTTPRSGHGSCGTQCLVPGLDPGQHLSRVGWQQSPPHVPREVPVLHSHSKSPLRRRQIWFGVQHPPPQHFSPGLQQVAVVFVRQGVSRDLQQNDRRCEAHFSQGSQHDSPHALLPGRTSPLQQSGLTGPRPQTPAPTQRDFFGSQGLQQNISQQLLSPHLPLQHAQALGQHVGKHASDAGVQYFHPSSETRVSQT